MNTAAKDVGFVPPFAMIADHPRNCDLQIQSVPNCRLRSRIISSRTVKDKRTGEEMVPVDQSRHLGALPEIPGMVIHVDPENLTVKITDPLYRDDDFLERVSKRFAATTGMVPKRLKGNPPHEETIDADRMKTLCRELINIVKSGHGKWERGPTPDIEDVNELPGEYLLNPGSLFENQQPRYEKDYDEWKRTLK